MTLTQEQTITVETTVSAPIAKVWRDYTSPEAIVKWNAASDDWHTTEATVDLREGGAFSSRMEAKDKSAGFDFAGTYTKIVENELIEYAFGDRTATVEFIPATEGVTVRVTFVPETEHSIEQQRFGWQVILDNFKKYSETTRSSAINLQPIPYLLFNGNCAEAMDFYAQAIGGKIVMKMSLADIPGAGFSGPEAEAQMCHVRLELPGGGHLYAGDVQMGTPPIDLSAVHVALNLATAEEGERVFQALAEGGVVEMEYQPNFWSEKFGMLKDKFGVSWMINGNLKDLG